MRAKGTGVWCGVAPARCKTAERQAKSGEIKSCLLQVRVAAADKDRRRRLPNEVVVRDPVC